MDPRRNVELKARDPDPAATLRRALEHGAQDRGVLVQRDTYFRAPHGRLKLREEDGAGAVLIPYVRADEAVARTSSYRLVPVPDPEALKAGLEETLGQDVVVAKRRHLLLWRDVRIHLDDVEGLGAFVELEAVAPTGSDLREEHAKVAELVEVLQIGEVEPRGYAQLLRAATPPGDELVVAARTAFARAYAPYSRFAVGAALRDEHGRVHLGANVENASSPQGQCAEASALGALVAAGGTRVVEAAVLADTPAGTPIVPCGGCRQRLSELADPATPVHLCGPEGVRRTTSLGALLPFAFDLEQAQA